MFRCSYVIVGQARNWMPDAIGGVVWFGEDALTRQFIFHSAGWCDQCSRVVQSRSKGFLRQKLCLVGIQPRVKNLADLRYNVAIEIIKEEYTKFETEFLANQPLIEKVALDLYAENPKRLSISLLITATG